MQDIYQTFEFNKILQDIADLCKTEKGKEDVLNIHKFSSKKEVVDSLNELKEMTSIISRYSYLPISTSINMINIIELAKKTALLTPRDLSLVREDILTGRKLTNYFSKVDNSYPVILNLINQITDLSSLEKEIKRVITPALTVSDHATNELFEIRTKLKNLESNLNSKVASIAFHYSALPGIHPVQKNNHPG